jgi:hypothetical protein
VLLLLSSQISIHESSSFNSSVTFGYFTRSGRYQVTLSVTKPFIPLIPQKVAYGTINFEISGGSSHLLVVRTIRIYLSRNYRTQNEAESSLSCLFWHAISNRLKMLDCTWKINRIIGARFLDSIALRSLPSRFYRIIELLFLILSNYRASLLDSIGL